MGDKEFCCICSTLNLFIDGDLSWNEIFVCIPCQKDYLYKYDGSLDQKIESFIHDESLKISKGG